MKKYAGRGEKIRARRDRLNDRLKKLIPYCEVTTVNIPTPPYPTLTQAKKAMKAIPRNIRESYEKSLREGNKAEK